VMMSQAALPIAVRAHGTMLLCRVKGLSETSRLYLWQW
jgi:hypothetical protein